MHPQHFHFIPNGEAMLRDGIMGDIKNLTDFIRRWSVIGVYIRRIMWKEQALLDTICYKVAVGDRPVYSVIMLDEVLGQMR
jgi:hypothetical protein